MNTLPTPAASVSFRIGVLLLFFCTSEKTPAQVNTGSTGRDGALVANSSTTVIDMADHPDGIYHYTSVTITSNASVTFIPNANNTPVVWLVQGNVIINGTIHLSARHVGEITP